MTLRVLIVLFVLFSSKSLSAQDFAIFYNFDTKLYQLESIKTGELRPETYEELYFKDDKYFIKINGEYGILDASGRAILEPVYYKLSSANGYYFASKDYREMTIYNRNFEIIKKGEYTSSYKDHGVIYVKNIKTKKYGVLDSLGKTILPEIYDYVVDDHRLDNDRFVCIINGKYGLVDYNNEIIIPFEYGYISLLNNENVNPLRLDIIKPNNLYLVSKNITNWEMSMGVMDYNGKIIIPLEYSDAYSVFNNGLVSLKNNGKSGYLNLDNEVVIPFIYDEALPFAYGVASVKDGNNYGVINTENEIVVPFDNYRNHFVFSHGLSKFSLNYGKVGVINAKGEVIIAPKYDAIEYVVSSKFFRTRKDMKQGVVDINGKEIIPAKYNFVQTLFKDEENNKTYFFVGIDGENGVIDENDKIILDLKYRYVSRTYDMIIVSRDDKHGILDLDFNVVVAPKYIKMRVNDANCISVGDENGANYNIDSKGRRTTATN